ncbi:helix-turn-helix domain-containing protein [uncultured Vibrio sp.]|nr:helix-turn-helix domain-containing protein [uncultured Vibrio sp.]
MSPSIASPVRTLKPWVDLGISLRTSFRWKAVGKVYQITVLFGLSKRGLLFMAHLMPISKALVRGQEKELLVLRFLAFETYTNFEHLCFLLQSAKSNTSSLLKRMVTRGLLIKRSVTYRGRDLNLWGITALGVESLGDVGFSVRCFNGLRFSLQRLDHKLMTQRTRMAFSQLSWADFQTFTHHQAFKEQLKLKHYPDALVHSRLDDGVFAVEVVLTLKTVSIYRAMIKEHIIAKRQGAWSHVVFVVENEGCKHLLQNRFNHIKYIAFDESRQPFECHEAMVSILVLEDMIRYRFKRAS